MKLIKKEPYLGLDIEIVYETMEGDLTFIGEFDIQQFDNNLDFSTCCAVFHNANPDRKKNHKDYMVLFSKPSFSLDSDEIKSNIYVSGIDAEELEKERYRTAVHCPKCDTVTWSQDRHDMSYCQCGAVAVDGGGSYGRIIGGPAHLKFDVLLQSVVDNKGKPIDLEIVEREKRK